MVSHAQSTRQRSRPRPPTRPTSRLHCRTRGVRASARRLPFTRPRAAVHRAAPPLHPLLQPCACCRRDRSAWPSTSPVAALAARALPCGTSIRESHPAGDDDFYIVSATDGDVRHAKTDLYNATARRGEVLACSLRVESTAALAVALRIRPLLTVCGLPCWDLSVLGSGVGVLTGPTAAAFAGFFERLAAKRSPLLIIEEVDALLFAPNAASFRFITRHLQRLGYHWRVRVLDAAKLGAAQQRLRAYLVCALDAAVLAAFSWPSPTHKRRSATLAEALLPVGSAPRSLFLNPTTKVARALSRPPPDGLARPSHGYSRVASVYDERVHVLSSARACVGTITASRSSGLYVWEGDALRRLAGVEALRLFTFSEREAIEFATAAEALGITSVELAEMAGDSFVVVVMAQLMRALVDAYSAVASDEDRAPWQP